MNDHCFWRGKKVFLTGHTGFKGAWLALVLTHLGATVAGYALPPPTEPSLFALAGLDSCMVSTISDIRKGEDLARAVGDFSPGVVIHMAAQALVRESYRRAFETYEVNVMGTVNLLEAVRKCPSVKALVIVTTDKVYENREWFWPYRESEPLGGYDPYSASKACAEIITSSYRNSFFNPEAFNDHGVALATVRSGNVIGGGDWAAERLVPDCINSFLAGEPVMIRYPEATRPWQHVLEPLLGYLMLAEKLYHEGYAWGGPWNFGPAYDDARTVLSIVDYLSSRWEGGARYLVKKGEKPHEAGFLRLDSSKALTLLGWAPRWNLDYALDMVLSWTHAWREKKDMQKVSLEQVEAYLAPLMP
ncbi:MAG: CDP-glucose 4,6-dehydratase [Candidatus Eremiobacteraeota bacterium]|nr:CDP-glucose 4,6-dehydratase [Candidatus Eremiobacteraeota bacterium]